MGRLAMCLGVQLLVACTTAHGPGRPATRGIDPAQLAKSDIDRVAEAHQRDLMAALQTLAEKLYRRNPKEWKKGGWSKPEDAVQRLFGKQHNWRFPELDGRNGTEAIQLALKPDYAGDRVFAYIGGLGGVVLVAFRGRYESYIMDDLDAQKLYNAARNFEIAAWKLSNNRGGDGNLLLLSNDTGVPPNLSFEREFGKMIGNLDLLAQVIADKTNRTVVRVVQNMATALFLPMAGVK